MLAVFNEAGWPESVQIDNFRLMGMIDMRTERAAISARDKLVEAGFIRYIKGKSGTRISTISKNIGWKKSVFQAVQTAVI